MKNSPRVADSSRTVRHTDRGRGMRQEAATGKFLVHLYHGCNVLRQTLKDANQGNHEQAGQDSCEVIVNGYFSESSGFQVMEALEPSPTEPVRPPAIASGSPPASSILRRWTSRISRRMAASASRYCSSVREPSSSCTWSSRSCSLRGASSVHCSSATLRRVFMTKLNPLNGARRRSSIKNM